MGNNSNKDAKGLFGLMEARRKIIAWDLLVASHGGKIAVNGKVIVVFRRPRRKVNDLKCFKEYFKSKH